MAASSPTEGALSAELLSRIVLQAEEAHARLERTASATGQHGLTASTAGRRLAGTRPIMGALRRKRLQLAVVRWRGTEVH